MDKAILRLDVCLTTLVDRGFFTTDGRSLLKDCTILNAKQSELFLNLLPDVPWYCEKILITDSEPNLDCIRLHYVRSETPFKLAINQEWPGRNPMIFNYYFSPSFKFCFGYNWTPGSPDTVRGVSVGLRDKFSTCKISKRDFLQFFCDLTPQSISVYSNFRPSIVFSGNDPVCYNIVLHINTKAFHPFTPQTLDLVLESARALEPQLIKLAQAILMRDSSLNRSRMIADFVNQNSEHLIMKCLLDSRKLVYPFLFCELQLKFEDEDKSYYAYLETYLNQLLSQREALLQL